MVEKISIKCPNCNSKNTRKHSKRKNKYQTTQIYFCKDCKKYFSENIKRLTNKTYPSKIILNAISYYNLGYSQQQTAKIINQRFKIKIPQRTISEWISQYKSITTFNKLRQQAKTLYPPEEIIEQHEFLHNNLPYTFKFHKAKLHLLFKSKLYNNQFINSSKFYEPLKNYLEKITGDKFPHHIFKQKQSFRNHRFLNRLEIQRISNSSDAEILKNSKGIFGTPKIAKRFFSVAENNLVNNLKNNIEQRASQLKFPHLKTTHLSKTNLANKLTALALNLAKSNKDRHNAVQNFMLINDSTTIAAEVPVYLTQDDITYFISRKFTLPLENQPTPITGHIDLLQIRNGIIHILDYKPDAHKKEVQEQAVQQLTIYALALASKTKLALSDFKCAFFDEDNYFEFFPPHIVYKSKIEQK